QQNGHIWGTFWSTWRTPKIPVCVPDAFLPDLDAIGRREVELLARLDIECLVPCVDISDSVRPEFVRRMAVRHDDDAKRFRPHFAAPALPECNKEALIAREPVRARSLFAAV